MMILLMQLSASKKKKWAIKFLTCKEAPYLLRL